MATAGRASRSPLQAPGWLLQTCVLLRLVHMHRDTYESAAEPTRFERGLPVTKGPMEANRVAASVGSEPRGAEQAEPVLSGTWSRSAKPGRGA
jgi:hypothetical protein